MPARLFRSRADWPQEVESYPTEQIGSGSLAKMVRIALSDPDDAVWAYTIEVDGQAFAGDAIRSLPTVLRR